MDSQTSNLVIKNKAEALGVTGEHPFYVRVHGARSNLSSEDDEGEWIEAKDLRIGDEIRTAQGNWSRVESISRRKEGATVYNFEVEDNHNYFVGQTSLLAHNDCFVLNPAWKKWTAYMAKNGWTKTMIQEAVDTGTRVPYTKGANYLNPGNPRSLVTHPTTGLKLVIDDVTNEIIQLGGKGWLW